MKKAVLIFLTLVIVSCSSDDDNNKSSNTEEFRLTRYAVGFLNVDTFGDDDVIWTFNFNTNVLTVVNNVSAMYPGLVPSGTYNFTFVNNTIAFNYNMIVYESEFDLSENDTKLTLFFDLIPQAIDDENLYEFERI